MNSKPKSGLISRQSSQLKPPAAAAAAAVPTLVVVVVVVTVTEGEGQRPRDLKWNSHQFRLQEKLLPLQTQTNSWRKLRPRKIVVSISQRVKYVLIYLGTHWTLTFTQTTILDARRARPSSPVNLNWDKVPKIYVVVVVVACIQSLRGGKTLRKRWKREREREWESQKRT